LQVAERERSSVHRQQVTDAKSYIDRYWAFDWQRQFESGRGLNLFLSIADQLASRFDVVVIDARTGLTDLGLVSTRILADCVVLVFGLSDQNLEGLGRAYAAITQRVG